MSKRSSKVWLAGVDGCPGGWVVAFVRPSGEQGQIRVVCDFAEILDAPERPKIVVVDIPIGLPIRSGAGGREPERSARAFLTQRRSSVFSVPSRSAVFCETGTYKNSRQKELARKRASKVALKTSDPPRKISIQSFAIFPKIREVDNLIRRRSRVRRRVFESHPEVAFQALKGAALLYSKKLSAGLRERRKILSKAGLPRMLTATRSVKKAAPDDIVDALVCAAVARRKYLGKAQCFPTSPKRDQYGIAMAIWA